MHTPLEVTEDALAWCREHDVDGLVPGVAAVRRSA